MQSSFNATLDWKLLNETETLQLKTQSFDTLYEFIFYTLTE